MSGKIHVTDDELFVLKTVEKALAKIECPVAAAENREELGTVFRQAPFELMTTDKLEELRGKVRVYLNESV